MVDAGLYTVCATNEVGEACCSAILNVRPGNYMSYEGKATQSCQAAREILPRPGRTFMGTHKCGKERLVPHSEDPVCIGRPLPALFLMMKEMRGCLYLTRLGLGQPA